MEKDIILMDNLLYGGWREPINIWQDQPGSIHNDQVAQKVGMRGGTIPGTIHLNLFPPLFLEIFGEKWFENGSISMYYTYATTHKEKVRAVIEIPNNFMDILNNCQLDAWIETPENTVVAKGTVSVGNVETPSYVQKIQLKNSDSENFQILKGLNIGEEMIPHDFTITQEELDKEYNTVCDPLDYYEGKSPWGLSVVYPSKMYHALMLNPKLYKEREINAVGFFGATELRNLNGPILIDKPYKTTGKIICVGESPKTEFFWYDSILEESESGIKIASMRKLIRFMKSS